ncbi:excisionase family DNA-binding protein [Kitasatospora sp. NPDC004615]|uniref:excisionase family DNA-binding protein n=1 Tax=Kitasatospora sp. NPDC004615 TaxID=3364017 RepID=UPI0036AFAF14
MAPAIESRKIAPGDVDAAQAERALRRVRSYLTHTAHQNDDVTILGETGSDDPLVLPRPTVEMFAAILAALANGQGVQLLPVNAEVSTQTAAEMLNVSRPFLIGLLEQGEIPYRLVGRHRRILFNDVIEYKRTDDRRRKDAADALTELDEELGLL